MPSSDYVVRFWGVRGSVTVSGPQFARVGGHTSCVEMRCGERVLLFDAGSGLHAAGVTFEAEGRKRFDLFLSHCHYDHILGLPFFKPLFDEAAHMTIHSGHLRRWNATKYIVGELMRRPFFPVGPEVFKATLEYNDFTPGEKLKVGDKVDIATHALNHPGGAVGYRVEHAGRVCAFITDLEHTPGEIDPALASFVAEADLMIYDSAYTDAELRAYRGFGHSTWQQAIRLSQAANVKRVALFHHSQHRDDNELDAIEREARAAFAGAFLARQDMEIAL